MSADELLHAVLRVLEDAGKALSPSDIRVALRAGGLSKAAAENAWPVVQKLVKDDPRVSLEGSRYRWVGGPPGELSPAEALDLLLEDGLPGLRRSALAEVVRAALSAPAEKSRPSGSPAEKSRLSGSPATKSRPSAPAATNQPQRPEPDEARRRQAQIDGVRLLAELAGEVEELLANETEPAVMIRQIRAWVKRSGLEPVGQAGESTRFDRTKHRPITGRMRDGASVIVVRPGYIWKRGTEDVLLGKAVVEE